MFSSPMPAPATCVLPALHVHIGGAVQQHRGARSGLGHRARAVGRLARLQHAAAGPGGGVEIGRRAAGRGPVSAACRRSRDSAPSTSRMKVFQAAFSLAVSACDCGP